MISIAAMFLAPSADAGQPAISVVCTGTAMKDERVGTTLDLLSGNAHTQRVGSTDSARFLIYPDNTGTAQLPHRLYAYHEANPDGSFPLLSVAIRQDEIIGRVRINANYKPSFRLDRITGVVTLNGILGEFSGECEAYDPQKAQRKF